MDKSGVTIFLSTAPTLLPQKAKLQPLKAPMAHRKKERLMMEVFPERTAPSQIRESYPE